MHQANLYAETRPEDANAPTRSNPGYSGELCHTGAGFEDTLR
jgi:hypothetical protein